MDRPAVGAATGYRWFIPARPSLANHLLYSINSSIALFFGYGGRHLVWGGSWAIRRETFEKLAVREAWKGTLSDDLVVSRIMRQHRLRVLFQPPCMVASPLDHNLRSMFGFLRRQYLIGRFYAPKLWLAGLSLGVATLAIVVGSLAMAVSAAFTHCVPIWIPAGVFVAHYALNAVRAAIRQSLADSFFPSLRFAPCARDGSTSGPVRSSGWLTWPASSARCADASFSGGKFAIVFAATARSKPSAIKSHLRRRPPGTRFSSSITPPCGPFAGNERGKGMANAGW